MWPLFWAIKSYSIYCVVMHEQEMSVNVSVWERSWFSGRQPLLEQIVKLGYYYVYNVRSFKRLCLHGHCPYEVITLLLTGKNSQGKCVYQYRYYTTKKWGNRSNSGNWWEQIGKRKYHQGKRVDGVWVFGGNERETKKCFYELKLWKTGFPTR